ncbi:transcription factor AP-4 isoform X2 [Clupea harengus]|uniref:Transcription factor AP-4 isoform X2 n=1 Tax=Clupea harengus TaxID=7950 RepID=A0A6P8F7I5_CLUHA|nr:transcription factor AP-4 isoform X2 [Clupea harengus]
MKNMEYFMVPAEKVSLQQFRKSEKEVIGGLCSLANIPLTPESARDQERRIRREIANSNERRRMQSINSGFQSLKTLIPHSDGEKLSKVTDLFAPHSDGEKLSKAAILQQTAEYIIALEQEKTQLLQQNNQLKRFIQEFTGSSPKRRRTEEKDEGIGSPDILEEEKLEDLRRELLELRQHLEKERSARAQLEEQLRSLDTQLYPEKLKAVAQQVQEQHSLLHTQTLLRLQQLQQQQQQQQQQQPERDSASRSPQVMPPPTPPAPTHHPTVIVPAPTHFATAAVSPNPSSNIMSTSRQNLDTIVQAIQHIEGTQRVGGVEEEQRRAVIVTPRRVSMETTGSDTASDSEGEGNFAMT